MLATLLMLVLRAAQEAVKLNRHFEFVSFTLSRDGRRALHDLHCPNCFSVSLTIVLGFLNGLGVYQLGCISILSAHLICHFINYRQSSSVVHPNHNLSC